MTVDGSLTVASVTIMAQNLQFTYSAASSQFSLTGGAGLSIGGLGSLSVSFGNTFRGTVTPGLVVSNGALQSLDMTVVSLTVPGVSISVTNVQLTYGAASGQFSLSGAAGVSISGIIGLSVTFGHSAGPSSFTPGLVVSSGSLQSLDMTINSNIVIGSVTFMTNGLEFTYSAASNQFTLAGSVGLSITGIAGLSVTFGHSAGPNSFTPGLIVASGSLQSLVMTINSNITIGTVAFMTDGLEFTYSAAGSQFTLAGSVGLSIASIAGLSVTFGYSAGPNSFTPGLIIVHGALRSLDMTIDSNITIGTVSFMTDGLEFTWGANSNQFTLAGSVGVSISGIAGLSVTFGQNNGGRFTPGLIIKSGALQSLDVTIDSNISIGSVSFMTSGLRFTYSSSPSQFSIGGIAGVSISGIAGLSVTFGHAVSVSRGSFTPGLIISGGSLQSLNMTINANIEIGTVKFMTNGLEFMYNPVAQPVLDRPAAWACSISGIAGLSVTFGQPSRTSQGRGQLHPGPGHLERLAADARHDDQFQPHGR